MWIDKEYQLAIMNLRELLEIDDIERAMVLLPKDDVKHLAVMLEHSKKEYGTIEGGILVNPTRELYYSIDNQQKSPIALNNLEGAIKTSREYLDIWLDILQEGYYHCLLRRVPMSELHQNKQL